MKLLPTNLVISEKARRCPDKIVIPASAGMTPVSSDAGRAARGGATDMRPGKVWIRAAAAILLCAACVAVRAGQTPQAQSSALAASAPTTLAASLPLRREGTASTEPGNWAPSFALLALTGAAGAWLLWRKTGRGRARSVARSGQASVLRLSSQALTPQASVHAVQWRGEEYLLGCTAQQVTLLCRRPIVTDGGDAA